MSNYMFTLFSGAESFSAEIKKKISQLCPKSKTFSEKKHFEYKRFIASRIAVPTALCILLFFPLYNFYLDNYSIAYKELLFLAVYLILVPLFYKRCGLIFVGRFSLFVIYLCILVLMYDFKADNYFTIWIFALAFYSLVLFGHIWGTVISGLLLLYTIFIMWIFLGETTSAQEITRYTIAAVIVLSIGFFYELSAYRTFVKINELNKTLRTLTTIDDLTGLHNRRFFNEIFQNFLNPSKRAKNITCFMIVDIDYFKQYNDTYGHQKGDIALKKVAKSLRDNIRRTDDYCCRLGGEEFGILFKADKESSAHKLAGAVIHNVEDLTIRHRGNKGGKYLTISAGLACKSSDESFDYETMYKVADQLLYNAKANGRNQFIAKKV